MGAAARRSALSTARRRLTLVAILLLTLLVAYLDRVNVSVLAADAAFLRAIGILGQPVRIGLLMTCFLVAYGVANVVLSPLGDVLGPRRAMCLSVLLWGAALVQGGLSRSFASMISSRIALGLGEGLQWPMQSKYVKSWFPPRDRGKANAVWLVGLMAGPAFAMPFFTWVVKALGWSASFFLLATMGLAPLALLFFFTADSPAAHRSIGREERELIEAGLREEAEAEAALGPRPGTLAAIASFAKSWRFWLLTLFYSCFASVWWGMMAWLPSYLKEARGFSWSAMGGWASLPYLLGAGNVLLCGWLTDRFARRAPFAALSMLGAAAGLFFGAHAEDNRTAAVVISLGIASIAIGLPASWTLLQQIVPARAVGSGAGAMNGVANGLSALAPVVIGGLIAATKSYMAGLMFLVALTLVGLAAMIALAVDEARQEDKLGGPAPGRPRRKEAEPWISD
jgi:sugar phosphate permease